MTLNSTVLALLFLGFIVLETSCSKSDDAQPCDDAGIVLLETNICLLFEHDGLSEAQENSIENKLRTGIPAINSLLALDNLNIRIVKNAGLLIPEIGLGGYNTAADEILIAIDENFADVPGAIEEELIPLLAHEMHHAKRRRSVGYGNTLLQATISEGLADHFSVEATGVAPPPWSLALTGSELQDWIDIASDSWSAAAYDHNAWFFGTSPNIPRWAGYAIGYELVKNYLADHPDQLPSALHNEPADSFLP